ncbi:UAA transporter family-domain-containing protein [Trametes gibbosa]|nr:UAA transporter family-domain-containing protein [Trametes gibbosa]
MSTSDIVRSGLTLAVLVDWSTTLSLIFGGCCSNALTLEHLTRAHPHAGSVITFAQFVLISLHGLPKFVVFSPHPPSLSPPAPSPSTSTAPSLTGAASEGRTPRRWAWVPRLRARRTPLAPYLAQVALFYALSLLNNAAFAYGIPMAVQIIFRSGGLVVSMLMGWLLAGKRYNTTQVLSVLLVTAGVALTTFSAATPKKKSAPPPSSLGTVPEAREGEGPGVDAGERGRYATGIALLTLALVLSGLLGIVQDWTYARYVRAAPAPASASDGARPPGPHAEKEVAPADGHASNGDGNAPRGATAKGTEPEPWQESMFYLHFLSLPMFYFVRHDLAAQARALHASPRVHLALPLPASLGRALTLYPPFGLSHAGVGVGVGVGVDIPRAYLSLAGTAGTALVCVAGVHRLAARGVSALAVTLLLVVRKAASLVLSVLLFRAGAGSGVSGVSGVNAGVWAGAGMVFAGTVGYAGGSRRSTPGVGKEKRE